MFLFILVHRTFLVLVYFAYVSRSKVFAMLLAVDSDSQNRGIWFSHDAIPSFLWLPYWGLLLCSLYLHFNLVGCVSIVVFCTAAICLPSMIIVVGCDAFIHGRRILCRVQRITHSYAHLSPYCTVMYWACRRQPCFA